LIQIAHRIVLTEKCNLSCPHCFNANVREDRVMDVDLFIRFMEENSSSLNDALLKIMGGEPTVHPRILEVMKESVKHYGNVSLFTNGTTMAEVAKDPIIIKNHFQGRIGYVINGFTFNIKDFTTYRDYIHSATLHFVIPLKNHEAVIEKIEKCMELYPQVWFVLSPDTQLDLIDGEDLEPYRKVWTHAITTIVSKLRSINSPFNFDHRLPMCFYTQEMIDEFHSVGLDKLHQETTTCCGDQQIGLIGYNFDIYYCNQTRIKLGSLLDTNGNPRSVEEINEMIQSASKIKVEQIKNISDKCHDCNVLATCKVGCYYNNLLERNENE